MNKYPAYIMITLSYILGGSSLLMFCAFCYFGSMHLVNQELTTTGILLFDAGLSLVFFLQHSGMVRKSFHHYLKQCIPEAYMSAIYSIFSGIVLVIVVVFWQETSSMVASAEGAFRFVLRLFFAASVAGFYWGIRSLGSFDPFGIRAIVYDLHRKTPKAMPLTIRGPYRWVRHPLYFFVLIMIWTNPDLTADRLLFNILWTVWIFIGAVLEERDLVSHFGEAYRQYQQKVAMIIPMRIFPSWPT
ncbi:MAG: isoprenylcysteine carboxylmethyltransferase family protein [Syntrophaceae bacterium]